MAGETANMDVSGSFALLPLEEGDLPVFKRDMREAFQRGAASELFAEDEEILPESDINRSLSAPGAAAFKAVADGEMTGGAIVVIEKGGQRGSLHFLYVKCGAQNRGLGQRIWQALEAMYPNVAIWETCTPYFEKRNIHFYINRCGFAAVEFFNPHHKDPHIPDEGVGGEYFFRFEKRMC